MPDLASTNVTVAMEFKDRSMRQRMHHVKITFGNGVLTYPAGGVPLPALSKFGLKYLNRMLLEDNIDGYVRKYDKANHTIRIYQAAGFTPAGSVAAPVFTGDAYTPEGTVAAPVFTGDAASFSASIYSFSIQNIKGADADVADSATVDQGALPTNPAAIDTAAAVAAGAWAYTENAEIDVPRNISICLTNDTGGNIDMEEGDLSFLVTGTFRGQAQSETITFTFTAGTKTIAHAPSYRWKYGVKPFDHITDIVPTGLTANQDGLKIGVGVGRLLGVPVEPKDNVVGDFVKVIKNSANLAPVAYDDTNKTLDLGALSDNDDLEIEVEVATLGESYTPTGTNDAPAFTGTPKAPTGTNSAPAFTGTPVVAAALSEVASGSFAPAAQNIYAVVIGS